MIKIKQKWNQEFNFLKKNIMKFKLKTDSKQVKIIFSLLIIFIYSSFTLYKKLNQKIETKTCICTLAKQENLYIREYLEHYKKYGINKIFLYDNNDINGEKFEDLISDYVKSGFVEIFNSRGRKRAIFQILNECFRKSKKEY